MPLDIEDMYEHNTAFHGPGRKSVNKFNLDLGIVTQLEYTNACYYFAVDLRSDTIKNIFPVGLEDFILTDAKIRFYLNDKISINQFKTYIKNIEHKNYFNRFMSIKNTDDMYKLIEDDESIKYYFGSIINFKMSADI